MEGVAAWGEFDAFWDGVSEEGLRARFRIQEVFRGSIQGTTDVWTGLHDCGIPFQRGETYLVYANPSKKGGRLETSVRDRTTRLSDAGEDLTDLYFVPHGGPAA